MPLFGQFAVVYFFGANYAKVEFPCDYVEIRNNHGFFSIGYQEFMLKFTTFYELNNLR